MGIGERLRKKPFQPFLEGGASRQTGVGEGTNGKVKSKMGLLLIQVLVEKI